MNNNILYEKNIENIKNEIDFLEKSSDFLKQDKIKVLKEQLSTFEQIIAKRTKIQKLKSERKNSENNNEYVGKKNEIKKLYEDINKLKIDFHSKYGYRNVLSSLFGQANKRISNFVNKNSFIYRFRRANYNLRYDHPKLNAVLKYALSGITLFTIPTIVGAIPLIITTANVATAFLKKAKGEFERKTPILNGTYLDNFALSLYGFGKSRIVLNTLINTMNKGKSTVNDDIKSKENEKNVELNNEIDNEKNNELNESSINDYDYYMEDLGLKEKEEPIKEIKQNSEDMANYYLKDLGFEIKEKKPNRDNWILKAKIKKVINRNTEEEYPEMTCLFYADGKKVKQETFRLDSLTDNTDYIVIKNSLMIKYPFLKKEPDITISNAEKTIEKQKNKSL